MTLPADGLVPSWPQLHDSLVLKRTTVTGGSKLSGTLVVVNDGSDPINLNGGCGANFVVVLTSSSYRPKIAWTAECSVRPLLIAPGVNRLPITILTTYLSCVPTPPNSTCGFPPLAAGRYQAVLRGELLALPEPLPVPVRVTLLP